MKKFNETKEKIDAQKAEILKDVLFMERGRYIFLIESYMKSIVARSSIAPKMDCLTDELPKWQAVCALKDALSVRLDPFAIEAY